MHHSAKEKLRIAKLICDNYATGQYTIDSCIDNQGISKVTFYNWVDENLQIKQEYKEAAEKAKEIQRGQLKAICLNSLQKMITGFTVEETHTDGTPIIDKEGNETGFKIRNTKKIKKHVTPSVTAIIFALKALDPEQFKDNVPPQQNVEQVFLIGGKEIHF